MHKMLQAGELTAIVGDNEAHGEHRVGYNGVHSLTSIHQPENLFVPSFAGLNLEHLLDGRDMPEREVLYEPRYHPMELEQIDERAVQLHQMTTLVMKVQSLTTFTLREPYYLDMEFRLVVREDVLTCGYLCCFWASYIHQPEDKSICFLGRHRDETAGEAWQRFPTSTNDDHHTVCHVAATPQLSHQMTSHMAFRYSDLAFTRPVYYGRRGEMVYALMFDRTDGIRFTHAPRGGGEGNPAWDFQLVIDGCEVDREYEMRARVVYKSWADENDVMDEYESWDPLSGE